ncbi:MAG: Ribosomal protein S12 methylthiotransferase RimO [Candidatus Anoxychlamydiales bacterium]|nr:Ribosomal protein S12 methylthiotransferase RimO [Candidatus Anoxychlamydiales bacterium]
MKKKFVYFVSLGCSRNLVDSETMIYKLSLANYHLTNEITKADALVVNTCGFLKEARDEGYSVLDEMFEEKKDSAKVIVTGCMANLFFNEIKKKYKNLHSIISAGEVNSIVEAVTDKIIKNDKKSFIQQRDFKRVLTTPSHLAYLKISEGCQKRCSYCIIPKIKGPLISRTVDSIIEEFKHLLENGVFEINLIAQDLLDYGKDRNEKDALINLIKEILKIKKDFWLRLHYVYPDDITDEFIDLILSDNRICNYLDMPLQHVSNNVLKNMRRKTTKENIIKIFSTLRKKDKSFTIRTSLMVGFPNETEDDFNELLKFIEDYQIDHIGVFKYVDEPFASSFKFDNKIDQKIIDERFEQLTKKQFDLVQKRNKKLIGKEIDVLVDGYHKESDLLCVGRTKSLAYDVDSNIIINDISKIDSFGKIYNAKIIDNVGYDLLAQIK